MTVKPTKMTVKGQVRIVSNSFFYNSKIIVTLKKKNKNKIKIKKIKDIYERFFFKRFLKPSRK